MSAPLDDPLVETSLEESLQRARPRLKVLFTRYRIPVDDTEDILQQALLALLYRRQSVRDPEAWLVGTVRNKCLLYWRSQRRKLYDSVDAVVLDWVAEPLAPAQEQADLQHDLRTVVERLPERCRSILSLRYGLGYEPPEVAERMGYSTSSISKVTTRCLAALTRQLLASGLCKKRPVR